MVKKYKYVRVPIKTKRRKVSRPKAEGYGLFSASDIGFDFGGSGKRVGGSGVGSFDFGGGFGGSGSKPLSIKQRYTKEKQDFDYSRKFDTLKEERNKYNREKQDKFIGDVKSGANKLGGSVSRFFKKK